jgi:hypothetical protein
MTCGNVSESIEFNSGYDTVAYIGVHSPKGTEKTDEASQPGRSENNRVSNENDGSK